MTVSEARATFDDTKPHFDVLCSENTCVYSIVSALHFERLLRMDVAEVDTLEDTGWYKQLNALVPAMSFALDSSQRNSKSALMSTRQTKEGGEDETARTEQLAQFEKKHFGVSPPLALCVADTDRVHEYVFEAARIPEVRGASALLERLNETEIACNVFIEQFSAPEQWIIYRGGGSLLAIVPASLQKSFQDAIEEYYPKRTLTATITVVTGPVPLKEICTNLGNWVDKFSYYLDIRKRQKLNVPHFQMLPYVEQCQLCGIRPAYKHYSSEETDVSEKLFVCDACLRKRQAWDKPEVTEWLKKYLNEHDSLKELYTQGVDIDKITWCNDLSEIGRTSNGYIAMIYGDGDDIGKVRKQLNSLKGFSEFAEGLKETTRHIVFHNLATYTNRVPFSQRRRDGSTHYHPFETITLGGDDLCIIVPAQGAMEIAAGMMREFAQAAKTEPRIQKPLQRLKHQHWGMSVGALICPDHFPIYYIYELVQELLKSAKQRMRKAVWKEPDASESYINFLILKGSAIPRTAIKDLTKDLYEIHSYSMPEEKQFLTERPYPFSKFEKLLQYARRLRQEGLLPTQLHAIARALYEEREQATFDLMMRLQRMPQACAHVFRELFFDETFLPGNQRYLFPWRQDADNQNKFSTVLLDVFELMEFLHHL